MEETEGARLKLVRTHLRRAKQECSESAGGLRPEGADFTKPTY